MVEFTLYLLSAVHNCQDLLHSQRLCSVLAGRLSVITKSLCAYASSTISISLRCVSVLYVCVCVKNSVLSLEGCCFLSFGWILGRYSITSFDLSIYILISTLL